MAGTMIPVVYGEGTQKSRRLVPLVTHTITSLFGGILSGAILGLTGNLVHLRGNSRTSLLNVLLGIVAFILALRAAGIVDWSIPESRWQVPRRWLRTMPEPVAAGLFGICLGAGVLTRITISLYVVLIWAVFAGDIRSGAIVMGIYGLARTIPIWVLHFISRGDSEKRYRYVRLAELWGPATSAASAAILTVIASLLILWQLK